MSRTNRRILFFIAILIFFAVSYVVLLYAQGYQYSFAEDRFVRSGAIYLNTNTSGAKVYIDDKEEATTSLITNSASISSLIPGSHLVSIKKDGYSIWHKKINVVAGFVEDFPQILLLPIEGQESENVKNEILRLIYPPTPSPSPSPSPSTTASPSSKTVKPTPTPRATATPSPSPDPNSLFYIENGSLFVRSEGEFIEIASEVQGAWLSDDKQKILWYNNGLIWVYWYSETNYQPLRRAGDIALIARFPNNIKAAQWFRGNNHIALDAGGLKVIEIDTRSNVNIISY